MILTEFKENYGQLRPNRTLQCGTPFPRTKFLGITEPQTNLNDVILSLQNHGIQELNVNAESIRDILRME